MNVNSTVARLIFAGMATFALSSVAVAESQTTGQSDMTQEEMQSEGDAPISPTDQEGMAGKDSANHEKMKKDGMKHGDKSKSGMSDDMQDMDDDAPNTTTDQEGMMNKDSANQEPLEEGM